MLTAINFYSLHKHNIFYETLLLFVISSSLPYQLEGFHLRVVRDLTEKTKTLPPPSLAPVSINTTAEAPKPNGSVSTPTSLAISKPAPYSLSTEGFLDKAADEGLVIIKSPRVSI
jgi:hypothetical protein